MIVSYQLMEKGAEAPRPAPLLRLDFCQDLIKVVV
jgi:hypothetical protein